MDGLGRTLTGRPHFARVLIDKGYATNFDEAFRRYLGETAPTYVERYAPYVLTRSNVCSAREVAGTRASHPPRAAGRRRRREIHP